MMDRDVRDTSDLKTTVLQEALEAAGRIQNEWLRGRALRYLAGMLSGYLLETGLDMARRLEDPAARGQALLTLAGQLAVPERAAALAEGLAAVRQIPEPGQQAGPLISAARLLRERTPGEEQSSRETPLSVGGEALDAIRLLDDPREQAFLLAELPDELLAEALELARRLPIPGAQITALAGLVERLPEREREAILDEALALANRMQEDGGRALQLSELVPYFTGSFKDSLVGEALAAAQASGEAGACEWVLRLLAPHLTDELKGPALAMARGLTPLSRRAGALLALAGSFSAGQREGLADEAFVLVLDLPDEWMRADLLARLAVFLPARQSEAALAAARSLGDPWARAHALSLMCRALFGFTVGDWEEAGTGPTGQVEVQADALAAARLVPGDWGRARALADVAACL